jgi:hypothetical protein
MDGRDDDARTAAVEQRDRRRLPARHLVVGVVAHEAMMRDGALQAPLDRAEAFLQAGRQVLDIRVQGAEVPVDLRCVGHEVPGVAVAENRALVRPQAGDPAGEHRHAEQRDQRHAAGREGGDPRGGRQLVHESEG